MSADLLLTELTAVARRFRLSAEPEPAVPQKIFISVSSPDANANQPLTLTPAQLTERLVDVPVTISWVTKDVGFHSATLPAPSGMRPDIVDEVARDVGGGQPIPGALSFNLVPGVIGRLTANLRLPIGQISAPGTEGLPVTINVIFRIFGPSGSLLTGVRTQFATEPSRGPVVATDLNNPFATLTAIIPVPVVRLTATPQLFPITIRATVQLTTTSPMLNTGPVELPPVTLSVPAIGVPTMALFFSRADFGRGTSRDDHNQLFIMIPRDLPLTGSVDALTNALQTLGTLLSALELASSAVPAPTLGSLGAVAGFIRNVTLPSTPPTPAPPILITQADGVADFYNDVLFFPTPVAGRDTPEDKMRSLILIGAPGETIECFNDKRFDIRQGQLNLLIQPGTVVAAIGDLNSLFPVSEPAGAANVVRTPTDWNGSSSSFADRFSSARFA